MARPPVARPGAVVPVLVVLTALLAGGCATAIPGRAVVAQVPRADLALVHAYVDGLNAAGRTGPDAQARYLLATQEPATPPPPPGCLGGITLETRIVDRTLRPDPGFVAPGARGGPARPAGAVYVVAASVSATRGGVVTREQIGSKHLVVRDGRVYGYSPCPN